MGDVLPSFGLGSGLDAVTQSRVGGHQQDAACAEHENDEVSQFTHLWRFGCG
jgi:hypothetical protein